MKKIFLLFLILSLSACDVINQKKDFEIIADCDFQLDRIEKFELANVPLQKMMQTNNFDFTQFPTLALAYFQKKIPLDAQIVVSAHNPSEQKANLTAFDYLIYMDDVQVAEGQVNEKTEILPESTTLIPIAIKGDVYQVIADNQDKWIALLSNRDEANVVLKIKVKPVIELVGTEMKMPGYLTFEKKIDGNLLQKNL